MLGPGSDGYHEDHFHVDLARVEPGRHSVFTRNGQHTRVFFDVSEPAELVQRSDQEHIDALREMTERAVISQMRANSPIATELSSGKDSSLVTAITAREMARRGQRIQTWSSVPRPGFSDQHRRRGYLVDESVGAKALVAMHNNIDHRFFYLEDQTPLDDLDAFVEAMDRMPLNACNLIWSNGIKKRAAETGHRVLLNGGMGNFTISYDGIYRLPDLLLSGRIRTWMRECRAMSQHRKRTKWRRLLEFSLGPAMPKKVWMALQRRRGEAWDMNTYSAISEQQRETQFRTQRWDLSYRPVRDGRRLMAECLTRMDLGDYYAAYNSFGLEVRSPLVDRRLITLCQSIPQALFFRDGQQSWVLRQALGELLPTEILTERKKGLQAADWFESASRNQGRFAAAVKELQDHATAAEMLNLASLDQLVTQWPEAGWDSNSVERSYRLKLLRGLSAGAFIRYVEDKNL